MLMTVPVFGHVSIPQTLRIWLMVIFAFLVFPSAPVSQMGLPTTGLGLAMIILSELAIGFAIGFAVIVLFSAFQFAGHLIGLQMGLAIASVVDPMSSGEISVVGEFYYLLALVIFLICDAHHYVIQTLVSSFELIPVGGGSFHGGFAEYLIGLTGSIFLLAIKFSAPVIIILFVINIVLGIVARTVPQMNVFIVGFTLAVGIGLLIIRYTLPIFEAAAINSFRVLETQMISVINLLKG